MYIEMWYMCMKRDKNYSASKELHEGERESVVVRGQHLQDESMDK